MKNILILLCILLLFYSCNKKIEDGSSVQNVLVTNYSHNKNDTVIVPQQTEEKTQEIREQLKKLSVLEIIEQYVEHENILIPVGDYNKSKDIGYFKFLSIDNIQWNHDTGGIKYYPYLYIIDNDNIRIEVFYYHIHSHELLGENITAGKYYINISKEILIARYIKSISFIEDYFIKNIIETNKYSNEDLFFKIQLSTDVFSNAGLHGEIISDIKNDTEVEVLDVFFNNLNDKYPSAVRIKTENISGWISINNVDFLKKEVKGTINGIWLHNEVRNVIKNYGQHTVKGKLVGNLIPLRRAPSNNSEQLILIQTAEEVFNEAYIEEVSINIETINGIEAAWYKIKYNKYVPIDNYEQIISWVFGGNLEINLNINY